MQWVEFHQKLNLIRDHGLMKCRLTGQAAKHVIIGQVFPCTLCVKEYRLIALAFKTMDGATFQWQLSVQL